MLLCTSKQHLSSMRRSRLLFPSEFQSNSNPEFFRNSRTITILSAFLKSFTYIQKLKQTVVFLFTYIFFLVGNSNKFHTKIPKLYFFLSEFQKNFLGRRLWLLNATSARSTLHGVANKLRFKQILIEEGKKCFFSVNSSKIPTFWFNN